MTLLHNCIRFRRARFLVPNCLMWYCSTKRSILCKCGLNQNTTKNAREPLAIRTAAVAPNAELHLYEYRVSEQDEQAVSIFSRSCYRKARAHRSFGGNRNPKRKG